MNNDNNDRTPPSWDPLGAAPFAWDLPDPNASTYAAKSSNPFKWVFRILIGIALAFILAIAGVATIGGTVLAAMNDDYVSGEPAFEDSKEDRDVYVANVGNLKRHHEFGDNDVDFDLSNVGPLDEKRTVTITHGSGDLNLTLPDDTRVRIRHSDKTDPLAQGEEIYNLDADGKTLTVKVISNGGELNIN
ncbi:hypothetical protein [Corynebacterium hindlerae]|uniref:hypothetical protein n=1 Tax=Corynebacterium hindlerae TaxID=699041 RepID=UPI0031B6A71D